jgi:hypothetical protein
MNYSFTVLIEHDDDAELFEKCMIQNCIGYEVDIIGDNHLIYEFTINEENKTAVEIIIAYNNITILKFKSNYN